MSQLEKTWLAEELLLSTRNKGSGGRRKRKENECFCCLLLSGEGE
jgi:hypothetical protein